MTDSRRRAKITDKARVAEVICDRNRNRYLVAAILASRLDETVEAASTAGEPDLAKYAFNSRKGIQSVYYNHKYSIEPDEGPNHLFLIVVADMARPAHSHGFSNSLSEC